MGEIETDWYKAMVHYRKLDIRYALGETEDHLTLTVQYTFTPFDITYHFDKITGKLEYITGW